MQRCGARGVSVRVELADVSDAVAVNEMLARMDRELPPLGGVIHSVGVLSDGALGNQSWERFEQVLWPKVLGAWQLHRATASRDLDLFVLFSSRVGVMGNPGQANHAAANAFLDQLAAHRRALGLPGQAIAWGAWSDIGEAAEQKERIERQRAALGGRWFTPQQGLRAMEGLVRQDVTNSVVMSMDWEVFREAVEERPPLLEELLAATDEAREDSPALADDLISRLQATPAAEREGLLSSFVQQELQAVLRLPNLPAPTIGFFDLGMDSLMAVELRNRLNRALADAYVASNTVVFDYPSVAALAGHLAAELVEVGAAPIPQAQAEPEPATQPARPGDGGQIAIVGMACQFPGAPDLDAYWRLLEAGTDAVTDGRQDSGPWSGVAGDPAAEPAALRWGGFVEGLDRFDAKFFGIRPIEARTMDPRQRMLLETSWRAFEDAGIDPGPLGGSRAGVYAGLTGGSEYRDLVASSGQDDSYLGTAASVALGRIAYTLGLMGPAVPVDATCASSLVAVHQAVAALQQGEVELALAGGVQTALSPSVAKFMSEYGMLSKTGRCRTFDAAADGFVRGEGCGMVILKRLRDAEEDGDRIWGVIRGSAVNQNGASAALTVPNGTAQEQLLEGALCRAGIAPADVDYIEAHGTGSQLGDPIELRAAAAVYGRGREADRPLVLGTAKTNIGHLEAAAGIAGLIKVMLAMKRGIIPRHLYFENPNPHVDWTELPVRVASEAMDWPIRADRPPCAGISAFAISGTNAHVIVEGYSEPGSGRAPDGERPVPEGPPQPVAVELPDSIAESPTAQQLRSRQTRLLPLSGKSDAALRELARSYASWLNERTADLSATLSAAEPLLSDMAWTASAGRSHFPYRAGVLFDNTASLRDGLQAIAESNVDAELSTATKVVFAYPGEGTRRIGMGEQLYECEPVARAVLEFCDGVLQADRGASLLETMFGNSGDLDDPDWTQPAAFALECALTALWASVGVQPSIVFGSGAGEIAAAHAAGMLTLEEGLRLAAARASGTAASPSADGSPAASRETVLEDISFAPAQITFVSSMTGSAIGSSEVQDAGYWSQQAGRRLPLERTARTVEELGADLVIEIGAERELGPALARSWPSASAEGGGPPRVLSSLPDQSSGFVQAVAQTYESGLSIHFAGLFAGERRSRVSLPSYPFQRRRFWFNGG